MHSSAQWIILEMTEHLKNAGTNSHKAKGNTNAFNKIRPSKDFSKEVKEFIKKLK